jgi:hypothetical protein
MDRVPRIKAEVKSIGIDRSNGCQSSVTSFIGRAEEPVLAPERARAQQAQVPSSAQVPSPAQVWSGIAEGSRGPG